MMAVPFNFNCDRPIWSDYCQLEVAPVREETLAETGEGFCNVCRPQDADFFTIYGRTHEGEAFALHDEEDPGALALALSIAVAESGLPIIYGDELIGYQGMAVGSVSELGVSVLAISGEDNHLDALGEALSAIGYAEGPAHVATA